MASYRQPTLIKVTPAADSDQVTQIVMCAAVSACCTGLRLSTMLHFHITKLRLLAMPGLHLQTSIAAIQAGTKAKDILPSCQAKL